MTHPRKSLDSVIHSPVRFSIAAALASVDEADFKTLREAIEITAPALSKQIALLEQAGYVKVRKAFVGKRSRTWLSLTGEGRNAFTRHLTALREIADWDPAGE
ncbi:transcriptional regulator [Streptomyces sp. 2224.1]|uniref:winged helix-turn-helix domain-containing protein n=1 Tax=unclassified Streptomyces TaxID=2593676 RepID=UPI000889C271|nr:MULTISPECIES: transcriptional regulator [unclassified Streptomyces]PBC85687.1 transcriptional regulator [Streptomyces sp. 2321.6]SDR08619.1 transcriptional regulator [Streptomyces sp. KS_16]SED76065.1 transcriptional regulator [Streptomyces sp. 2133.1]SEE23690.1 transcriptional regulator [Streptomyces sp. 2224.1]SNC72507.1 Winged helix DNA-binding domain-containing protein [Streptomyces sp. 2114.4]